MPILIIKLRTVTRRSDVCLHFKPFKQCVNQFDDCMNKTSGKYALTEYITGWCIDFSSVELFL